MSVKVPMYHIRVDGTFAIRSFIRFTVLSVISDDTFFCFSKIQVIEVSKEE